MSDISEGVNSVFGEARDLQGAIAHAAEQLGMDVSRVKHKLDMNHFRNEAGRPVPRDTVRVVAWAMTEEEAAAMPASRPVDLRRDDRGERRDDRGGERREVRGEGRGDGRRESRDRRDDRRPRRDSERTSDSLETSKDSGADHGSGEGSESGGREPMRGAEAGTTEASDFAQAWFQTLLQFMDVIGTVTGTGSSERVHLHVTADKAGRVVGKRGSTLGSIRHILRLALELKFGALALDVHVADDRPREDRPREDRPREDRRDDRPRQDSRPEGRDRGGRDRGGRDRGGRSSESSGEGGGRYPEPKLRELARRAAEKAVQTGKTITIQLDLNSYDRRIVHMEIADIDGVNSRSEEKNGAKYIQVIPETT